MIRPTNTDIGRAVIYYHHPDLTEDAVITSFNDRAVFIRFKGDADSFAARRGELDWKQPGDEMPRSRQSVGETSARDGDSRYDHVP